MARHRHHSGYLADDEAGHTAYNARVQPPRKPLFPKMRLSSKLGHEPHPPSLYGPSGSSVPRSHRQSTRDTQPFGSFLDFLTEGQVLDSLQTVVEEATERMVAMRTEAGEPLVEVQDPMEVPRSGRRVPARPSFSTVHRHRTQPSLCIGRVNNYPSRSSSASDSHSSLSAGRLGSYSRDSDLGARGVGSLPPMRDRVLLERSLKRLLRLENKGKAQSKLSSQKNSMLWDSMASQTSSQWTQEHPLSWFSEVLGSGSGTPAASELGPTEQELTFLRRKFDKEMKALLNQPASLDLPQYCPAREPYRALDFLAKHQLFPALQHVVHQAVDKLSGARRNDGCPLFFPTASEPTPEPGPPASSELPPGSVPPSPDEDADEEEGENSEEEPYGSFPTTVSGTKDYGRSIKNKVKEGDCPVIDTQVANKIRLQVTPAKEFKGPGSASSRPDLKPRGQNPPQPTSGTQIPGLARVQSQQGLLRTLPAHGVSVEMPSSHTLFLKPPLPASSHHLFSTFSLHSSAIGSLSPSPTSLQPQVTSSRRGLEAWGTALQKEPSFAHHS